MLFVFLSSVFPFLLSYPLSQVPLSTVIIFLPFSCNAIFVLHTMNYNQIAATLIGNSEFWHKHKVDCVVILIHQLSFVFIKKQK